jgi:hypothetical protein
VEFYAPTHKEICVTFQGYKYMSLNVPLNGKVSAKGRRYEFCLEFLVLSFSANFGSKRVSFLFCHIK